MCTRDPSTLVRSSDVKGVVNSGSTGMMIEFERAIARDSEKTSVFISGSRNPGLTSAVPASLASLLRGAGDMRAPYLGVKSPRTQDAGETLEKSEPPESCPGAFDFTSRVIRQNSARSWRSQGNVSDLATFRATATSGRAKRRTHLLTYNASFALAREIELVTAELRPCLRTRARLGSSGMTGVSIYQAWYMPSSYLQGRRCVNDTWAVTRLSACRLLLLMSVGDEVGTLRPRTVTILPGLLLRGLYHSLAKCGMCSPNGEDQDMCHLEG